MATITAAEYFHAGTAADLSQVYRKLSTRFALERKETELGALLAAGAAVLLVLGGALSLLWFRR